MRAFTLQQSRNEVYTPHGGRALVAHCSVRVRIDAGFTNNETPEALEDRGIEYRGQLRSRSCLQKLAPYLKRPQCRSPEQPREWCRDLTYQAGSWPTSRVAGHARRP